MDGLKEISFGCNCCMLECRCDEENSLQGLKKLVFGGRGGKNKEELLPEQTNVMEGVRLHGVCY